MMVAHGAQERTVGDFAKLGRELLDIGLSGKPFIHGIDSAYSRSQTVAGQNASCNSPFHPFHPVSSFRAWICI
jgi:hypothetical protein